MELSNPACKLQVRSSLYGESTNAASVRHYPQVPVRSDATTCFSLHNWSPLTQPQQFMPLLCGAPGTVSSPSPEKNRAARYTSSTPTQLFPFTTPMYSNQPLVTYQFFIHEERVRIYNSAKIDSCCIQKLRENSTHASLHPQGVHFYFFVGFFAASKISSTSRFRTLTAMKAIAANVTRVKANCTCCHVREHVSRAQQVGRALQLSLKPCSYPRISCWVAIAGKGL